jgi:hypothetical protein
LVIHGLTVFPLIRGAMYFQGFQITLFLLQRLALVSLLQVYEMAKLLLLVLGFVLESAVKRLLVGAGLGLVSMISIQTYFDYKLQQAMNQTGSFDNWVLGLLAIAKFDTCLSIIIAAVIARVTISAAQLTLQKL